MKTEGLSLVEAWKALLEGKCIRRGEWSFARRIDQGRLCWWYNDEKKWLIEEDEGLFQYDAEYSIVPDPSIPEQKSLTFEEAVLTLHEGGMVKIKVGDSIAGIFGLAITLKPGLVSNDMVFLDLAKRRGWPITEVSQ